MKDNTKDNFKAEMGQRIKISREKTGLTQEKLAEHIGKTTQYISDLERGKVGTALPTFRNICSTLQASSDYLLFGSNDATDLTHINNKLSTLTPEELDLVERSIDLFLITVRYKKISE